MKQEWKGKYVRVVQEEPGKDFKRVLALERWSVEGEGSLLRTRLSGRSSARLYTLKAVEEDGL